MFLFGTASQAADHERLQAISRHSLLKKNITCTVTGEHSALYFLHADILKGDQCALSDLLMSFYSINEQRSEQLTSLCHFWIKTI